MQYTRLGRTGMQVSRICLGMMGIGASQWRPWILGETEARPLVRRALELGINFFDTADTYSAGESELLTGRFLMEFCRREEVVIATKLYNPVSMEFTSGQDLSSLEKAKKPNQQGLSRKRVFAAVDASLRRLGTDYIDLYQIHRWDYATPVEEFMEALHDLVKAGKVRYLGASSMWAWQFAKAQQVAERNNWTRFVSMQNHYNLVYREEEREMLPLLRDQGVACIPWSPLARGFLTEDPASPQGAILPDRRRAADQLRHQYYSDDADFAVAAEVGRIATDRGVSRACVACAWLLSENAAHGGVTAPIVGPSSIQQLEDLASAPNLSLSREEAQRLESPYRPKSVRGHI